MKTYSDIFKPGGLYALCGTRQEAFLEGLRRGTGWFCPPQTDWLPEKDLGADIRLFGALFDDFSEKACRDLLARADIGSISGEASRRLALLALCMAREGVFLCFPDLIDLLPLPARNKAVSLLFEDPFRDGRAVVLAAGDVSALESVCDEVAVVRGEKHLLSFAPEDAGSSFTRATVKGDPALPDAACILGKTRLGALTEVMLALSAEDARAFLADCAAPAFTLSPMTPADVVAALTQGGAER